jgi:hypothetical protein
LIIAAHKNHRAIVEALLGARADVNTKERINGCVFPARRAVSAVADGRQCAVPPPSGRNTALHWAALNGSIGAAVPLLVGGADQHIPRNDGYAVPPTAQRRTQTLGLIGAGETPRQFAQQHNKLAEYDAAVAQARPPHRCRRIARASPASGPLAGVGTAMHARTTRMHRRSTHCMPRPRSSLNADAPAA